MTTTKQFIAQTYLSIWKRHIHTIYTVQKDINNLGASN